MEQTTDDYLDWSEEDEWVVMLVEPDSWFKQRYDCMMASAIVDVAGQTTTKVRVCSPYAVPAAIHGHAMMASMGQTSVKTILMNEESPFD